jgi:molybdopterin converting factor small subunit
MFASAREAAGCKHATIEATTVGEVLDQAVAQFGEHFGQILAHANVWLDGEPTNRDALVSAASEVAVLPPVSGG